MLRTSDHDGKTILIKRDLPTLAAAINAEHATATQHLVTALEHARRAGQALIEAKDVIPHGRFVAWVQENCDFSQRSARNYMLIARNWPAIEANRLAGFGSIRDAVKLLSADSTEPENGSALPFVLPGVGQSMLGHTDDRFIFVEAEGDHWIRTAVIRGDYLDFDKRGWHRDNFWAWLEVKDYVPEFWDSIEWCQPRPALPINNPFRDELPWKYETAVAQ